MQPGAFRIDWVTSSGKLLAREPTPAEVAAHAPALAAAYNDPHNAAQLGHGEPFEASEVVAHYQAMQAEGARMFLLFVDGQFAGDADFRGIGDGAAEFAFLVAARASQGKGLGTRFAILLHAFAFAQLGLHHLYASVSPGNTASRRVFEKLGFSVDDSATARAFADAPDDVVVSIDRATFQRLHGGVLTQIRIQLRDG